MSTAELACSYAALILADDGIEVSVRIQNSLRSLEHSRVQDYIWNSISCVKMNHGGTQKAATKLYLGQHYSNNNWPRIFNQADKIQTLIGAAKVPEVEPIWAQIFAKVNTWTYAIFRANIATTDGHARQFEMRWLTRFAFYRLSRARTSRSSWPTSAPLAPPPLPPPLPVVLPPLLRRRRRRRKRVSIDNATHTQSQEC
jgi:hypothetical protein